MPCNSSHMEPTKHEKESIKVAKLIIWVYGHLNRNVPEWISRASNDCYGDVKRVHDLTALLCTACGELDENILYNGRDRAARRLATWRDDHQEADRIKEEKKQMDEAKAVAKRVKIAIKAELRKQALAKLTPEEREALK